MARLIADKYKEWEKECDERFTQLKANEETKHTVGREKNGRLIYEMVRE